MPPLLYLIQQHTGLFVLTQMGMGQALQQQGREVAALQVVTLGGERQNVKLLLVHKGAQVLQHDAHLSKGQPMDEGSPAWTSCIFGTADFSFAAKENRRLLHFCPVAHEGVPLARRRITLI
jgi:hypothetical protein